MDGAPSDLEHRAGVDEEKPRMVGISCMGPRCRYPMLNPHVANEQAKRQ